MWAIAAAFCFALAFILNLLGTSTGDFSLLLLGLFFVAIHLAWGWTPWRRPG